ncbi:MAG: GIY-YIG nuclease family protein [Chloroflexi bacterium]|nr:GIY-YIG nuclease family protein [Chloroflexota bacterium]
MNSALRLTKMSFFCYLLECADGTYYAGWSTDPVRREQQHNAGFGARYTRTRRPVKLVYIEEQPDRVGAMRRERQIKGMTRAKKETLISNTMVAKCATTFTP